MCTNVVRTSISFAELVYEGCSCHLLDYFSRRLTMRMLFICGERKIFSDQINNQNYCSLTLDSIVIAF